MTLQKNRIKGGQKDAITIGEKEKRMFKKPWFLVFLFLSCVTSPYPLEYKTMDGYWSASQTLTFTLEETLLEAPHNLYLHLRNTDDYAYSNIFLIAQIKDSTQVYALDTLEYAMANVDGSWLGKGFGEVKESVLWWKENLTLEAKGPLTVEVQHAMRNFRKEDGVAQLEGIVGVGLGIVLQTQE